MEEAQSAVLLLPAKVEDVEERMLTSLLRKAGVLSPTTTILSMTRKPLGTDAGMVGDKILLEDIKYDATDTACSDVEFSRNPPPSACLVKLPPSSAAFPRAFVHACYERECNFYRNIAGFLEKEFGMSACGAYFVGASTWEVAEILDGTNATAASSAPTAPGSTDGDPRYVLVLEHLTRAERIPRLRCGRLSSEPQDQLSLAVVFAAVRELARLHAAFWQMDHQTFRGVPKDGGRAARPNSSSQQRIQQEHARLFPEKFVPHLADPGRKTQLCSIFRGAIPLALSLFSSEETPLEVGAPEYDGFVRFGDFLRANAPNITRRLGRFLDRLKECPQSLCHGDTTAENLFYNEVLQRGASPPDEELLHGAARPAETLVGNQAQRASCPPDALRGDVAAIWIDWQMLSHNAAARDVAWFLVSSLPLQQRREREFLVLRYYYDSLLASLPSEASSREEYSFERCKSDYAFCLHAPLTAVLGVTMMKWSKQVAPRQGSFAKELLIAGEDAQDARRELAKSNEFCLRVVSALIDHDWVSFLTEGDEDTEEVNPRDVGKPCNFG